MQTNKIVNLIIEQGQSGVRCYQFRNHCKNMTDLPTENIPVQIDDDVTIMVEATVLGGEEDVDFDVLPFQQVTKAVEIIAGSMAKTLEAVKPDKASIELGLEIGLKEGKLVTLIVQNSAKANLKINLEWGK